MLINEKTFLKSDYARQLAKTVTALAVRLIAGKEYRISRLSGLLGISWEQAESRIKTMDKEQKSFFKSVYQKDEADPDEFNLVINLKHIKDAS